MMVLSSTPFLFSVPHIANASTASEICIDTIDSTSCPSFPTVFGGSVGDQLTVAVNLESSQPIYGIDVVIHADPAALSPSSITYADTIVPRPFTTIMCINGANFCPLGSGTVSQGDIALGLFCQGCAGGPSLTSGRLFEITYEILENSTETVISPRDCSHNGPRVCATFNGRWEPDLALFAAFSNLPAALVFPPLVPPSPVKLGEVESSSIEIVSTNGFQGNITLDETAPASLECHGLNSTISVPPDTTALLSCSSQAPGDYTVSVKETGGGTTTIFPVTFSFSGFKLNTDGEGEAAVGSLATVAVFVDSIHEFTGEVELNWTIPHRLVCSLSPPPFASTFGRGMKFTCTTAVAGEYSVNITGTSPDTGSYSSSVVAMFTFTDFSFSPMSAHVSIVKGSSANLPMLLSGLFGFKETISLNASISPTTNHLPSVAISTDSVALSKASSEASLDVRVTTARNTTLATYVVTVMATSIVPFTCTYYRREPPVCSYHSIIHTAVVMLSVLPSWEKPGIALS